VLINATAFAIPALSLGFQLDDIVRLGFAQYFGVDRQNKSPRTGKTHAQGVQILVGAGGNYGFTCLLSALRNLFLFWIMLLAANQHPLEPAHPSL
jgi:hypothetical protein